MISIFKTNVLTTTAIEKLQPLLDTQLKNAKWNFDLEDCDNILRIDNPTEITQSVIKILRENNFSCEELGD